ncbi:MAG: helical backbone metal receptor [Planctomycetes bacterium]|nr:helical backbone metal receptor [Planctomycetota bacterium]
MSTDLLEFRGTTLAAPPRRIVSLYPSGTETLYALGLASRVVGRTSWCPVPAGGEASPMMGGTKNPDLARIRAAAPDLVLACRDENRREDVEAIEAFAPVLVADPRRVADVAPFVRQLAAAAGGDPKRAEDLAAAIESESAALRPAPRRRAVAFIWRDPWWTLGGNCYPTDLMRLLGLDNAFAAAPRSWFPVDAAAIAAARPEILLFPDEPFRFEQSHVDALRAEIPSLKDIPARLFDGSLLTWHGARTLEALRNLPGLLA